MNKEVIQNNMKIEGLSKYACPYEKGIRLKVKQARDNVRN